MSLYFAGFLSIVENQIFNTIVGQFMGEIDLSLALSYKEREPEYICYLTQLFDSPFRAKKAKHPLLPFTGSGKPLSKPLSYKERGFEFSPFPCREGGWGVRFFNFINNILNLFPGGIDFLTIAPEFQ